MTSRNSNKPEVLGTERRRRWSGSEKLSMVLGRETYEPDMTVSLVARKHGVDPNQVLHWRKLKRVGALSLDCCDRQAMSWVATTGDRAITESGVRR